MKRLFIAALATLVFAGCASTGSEMETLENRVAALERQVSSASDAGSQAGTAAAKASRDAAAAQATAQRALDAANAANQRAERMAETCCSRK